MFMTLDDIKTYMLAGKATLTLTSEKTGTHFIYRVNRAEDDAGHPKNLWFVGLLTGPDNYADYSDIGNLNADGSFSHNVEKPRRCRQQVGPRLWLSGQ